MNSSAAPVPFKYTFPPAIRRNWGYWDGIAARARGESGAGR